MFKGNSFAKYNSYLRSTKIGQNFGFKKELNKDLLQFLDNSKQNTTPLNLVHNLKNNHLRNDVKHGLEAKYPTQGQILHVLRNKVNQSKCIGALQNFINEKNDKLRKRYNSSIDSIKDSLSLRNRNTFLLSGASVAAASTSPLHTTDEFLVVKSTGDGKHEIVNASSTPTHTDIIPEPPPLPDLSEFLPQTNALGEATFASLGLGGYTPVGLIEQAFEYLHVTYELPWWSVIAIGTLIIRLCMFPLVIISQRNGAKMANNLPQMQMIQEKITEARMTGNAMDVARYSQELMIFMKKKGLNPFKNMVVPLAQTPIFISFFWSLREMANLPVQSLQTGGLFWFMDLTVPDQFYLLPIMTSITLWATIEVGTDSAKLSGQNMHLMKYVLRALPVIIFPFTMNFPGAVLCYWFSSNAISLVQVGLLRIPSVRDYFGIEKYITHSAEFTSKKKGFTQGIKESWSNLKVSKELEERAQLDAVQFQRAGKGPITKTYKFDPTKVSTPISAKKR